MSSKDLEGLNRRGAAAFLFGGSPRIKKRQDRERRGKRIKLWDNWCGDGSTPSFRSRVFGVGVC